MSHECCFIHETASKTHKLIEKCVYANKLHRMYLERELNKTGVFRSQHQILMYVAKHPNTSQKDIANLHHVSTATIAVTLKKLEKGGYIVRSTDKEDNRFNQITITDKGKELVESSVNVFRKVENAMFKNFSQEELDQMISFYERIDRNMEELYQETESEGVTE